MKVYGLLENAQLELLSAAPALTPTGRVYFDTTYNVGRMYMGSSWLNLDTIGVSTVSASRSLTVNDDTLIVDATSAAVALTLPLASSCPGKKYRLKKKDSGANAASFAPTGTDLIDGANASVSTTTQYARIVVVSDGTQWWVIT